MKYAVVLLLCVPAFASQPFTCPADYVDMLVYFSMDYPGRTTHHMGPGTPISNDIFTIYEPDNGPNYAESGIFFWIKDPAGWPWDVKSYDADYIYDRATEMGWPPKYNAKQFKRFVKDLPMSPRCIRWGEGADVKIDPSGTAYTFYSGCEPYLTQNLSYVDNQISKPHYAQTGNLGVIELRDFIYSYSCNSAYDNCIYQEVFTLGQGVGLVGWKYYEKGKLVKTIVTDQYKEGTVTPYLPCKALYQ